MSKSLIKTSDVSRAIARSEDLDKLLALAEQMAIASGNIRISAVEKMSRTLAAAYRRRGLRTIPQLSDEEFEKEVKRYCQEVEGIVDAAVIRMMFWQGMITLMLEE